MKNYIMFSAVGMATLLATTAMAEPSSAVKKLDDESYVTISGTVENVENEREFTLRDKTGTIGVDIDSNQSIVLTKGQYVTVSGLVDKNVLGTDINATNVYAHKGFTQSISDALNGVPGVSTVDAQAFAINSLPKEGLVKVTGIVTDVDNEKEFTIKDKSGTINVDITSSQRAALAVGSEVTVIGRVGTGILGKNIDATKVLVIAEAKSDTKK